LGDRLRVLYLIFNEGYTATSGTALPHVDLTAEAIRLTRQLQHLMSEDPEIAGLLGPHAAYRCAASGAYPV
jgi:predicted RNA polymerase sigma factor